MEKTKLSFEVDASQIDIKPILRKEFLELSMKAISSANPNRNNSWFTVESMEKSKHTFVNKPILGYFENGDFVSHNGDWNYDSETEMDYWDTLGKKGERILGTIRESDEVKIVQDKKGLYWIYVTCMLWTQYSYKQVKRLLKDAKQAAKKGGSAKNISVEVDITDWEQLPNGVMKINEFNLVGITILGSRNGVKVEPGIEDAELSVVDVMGRDTYEKQQQALRLAYERLDDSDTQTKEEFSKMENENVITEVEETVETSVDEIPENSDGNEGTVTFESTNEEVPASEPVVAENAQTEVEENTSTEDHENFEQENESCQEQEEKSCEEEQPEEEKSCDCEACPEENKEEEPEHECGHCEECPEEGEDPKEEEKSEFEIKCEELTNSYASLQAEHDELKAKFEALVSENEELKKQVEAHADYEVIKSSLQVYQHNEFLNQAKTLIESAKLEESVAAQFYHDCEESTIGSIADLKVKVAVAAFDNNTKVEETNTLSVPVSNPDVSAAFASKAEKSSKKGDVWSSLHEYIGK